MTSFPKAVGGAIAVGLLYQVLVFNFPNETGLVQFVLFIIVLVLVARISSADDAGGESFSFAPRVPPVPERLREIWWVRHMGRILAGFGLLVAIVLPLARHAVGASPHVLGDPRVRDLRGLRHRAHRLGRSALARPDGVRRHRRDERRRVLPRHHARTSVGARTGLINGAIQPVPLRHRARR